MTRLRVALTLLSYLLGVVTFFLYVASQHFKESDPKASALYFLIMVATGISAITLWAIFGPDKEKGESLFD